jgi:hypothetical protein
VTFKIFGVVLAGAFAQHAGIKQQSAFPQHFVQVSRLHVGVAISPSVVPLLLGYEHEHPVEQVPLPPESLIHFAKSAYQRHVHEPVQGCSVVVVVVVDDVLVEVVVVVVGAAVVVVLVVELVVVLVVVVDVLVVVGVDWQAAKTCSLKYAPGLDG